MIPRQEYKRAVAESFQMLKRAGIMITPEEKERFEVADFGLNELRKTGLQIITYVNTERCCAKEIVMFPRQTCPDHQHPTVKGGSRERRDFPLPLGDSVPVPQRGTSEETSLQGARRIGRALHGLAGSLPAAGRSIHART